MDFNKNIKSNVPLSRNCFSFSHHKKEKIGFRSFNTRDWKTYYHKKSTGSEEYLLSLDSVHFSTQVCQPSFLQFLTASYSLLQLLTASYSFSQLLTASYSFLRLLTAWIHFLVRCQQLDDGNYGENCVNCLQTEAEETPRHDQTITFSDRDLDFL